MINRLHLFMLKVLLMVISKALKRSKHFSTLIYTISETKKQDFFYNFWLCFFYCNRIFSSLSSICSSKTIVWWATSTSSTTSYPWRSWRTPSFTCPRSYPWPTSWWQWCHCQWSQWWVSHFRLSNFIFGLQVFIYIISTD